jgi:flavin-dependent dehydrogenase
MMDDENPRIAILGAGPIGLEVALYARYLGYPAQVFEKQGMVAVNVLALGERPVGEFGGLASRLGVSALRAQDTSWQAPTATDTLTAIEWHTKYLVLLAESDLVAEVLNLGSEVVEVARRDTDDDAAFVIRVQKAGGGEETCEADFVIDATGPDSISWDGVWEVDDELGFGNPEADFYVLGAKGGAKTFLAGLAQIRDLFAILGEREDLDVYATMPAIE